ncbi:MAG: hypothetical protein M3H12_19905, partial [Chromatiales bacterium]
YMENQQIPRTDNQDYLGVTIDTKLSWKQHINNLQNKARKTLGLLKRTLYAAPPEVRKTVYEALIRPTLEYATYAWSPHTKTGIETIEHVQRSAARFVTGDYRSTSSVTSKHFNSVFFSFMICNLYVRMLDWIESTTLCS